MLYYDLYFYYVYVYTHIFKNFHVYMQNQIFVVRFSVRPTGWQPCNPLHKKVHQHQHFMHLCLVVSPPYKKWYTSVYIYIYINIY